LIASGGPSYPNPARAAAPVELIKAVLDEEGRPAAASE